MMIRLTDLEAIDLELLHRVGYLHERIGLDVSLLQRVAAGHRRVDELLRAGVPCYGVSTALGRQVSVDTVALDSTEFARNVLRARAAASGPPLPRPVGRVALLIKLLTLLQGLDGVRPGLCEYLAAFINSGIAPWIPSLGHGMAGDAIGLCHVCQPLIGEGMVWSADGTARPTQLTGAIGVYAPDRKEAVALINGIAVVPAYAYDAQREVGDLLASADTIAALSMVALGAPLDSLHAAVATVTAAPGVGTVSKRLRATLAGCEYVPFKLQAPVSYRVIPQVHGALMDALASLHRHLGDVLRNHDNNPLFFDGPGEPPAFLSVGTFHDQHLVSHVEATAIAVAHVACLSERRLHRLLDESHTGLSSQLAPRPGLDAGLVTLQKAALDLVARVRLAAQPVSLLTGESSSGQEDYMSMGVPAVSRLYELRDLTRRVLACELVAILVALDQRQPTGEGRWRELHTLARKRIDCFVGDRAPGPDIEIANALLADDAWRDLIVHHPA